MGHLCCMRVFSSCGKLGLLSGCVLWAFYCGGSSCCGSRAQCLQLMDSRAWALQLWCMGLVAPRHMGSSRIRDQTGVSFSARFLTAGPLGNHRAGVLKMQIWKLSAQNKHIFVENRLNYKFYMFLF